MESEKSVAEHSAATDGYAVFEPTDSLPTKAIQIQAVSQPGDSNCGPHVQVYALCEDGSVWERYESSGFSNVPTDGLWRVVNKPTIPERRSRCRKCMGTGFSDVEVFGSFDCPWCSR